MLKCENIRKEYDGNIIFSNFSYSFGNKGFYLLFGESGCGKTTLLNMLAGFIPFENGHVQINSSKYTGKVNPEEANQYIAYITQDAYFIEYLDVFDNLRLCSTDDEEIERYLNTFDMYNKKNQFPSQLSGGEKQRLAIIRALLERKSVLLLDEPTASLDQKNKLQVFETLNQLKDSVLIICSSHDSDAKKFADKIIDFHRLNSYTTISSDVSSSTSFQAYTPKKRNIKPFIKKWFTSNKKERKSKRRLIIVYILTIIAICLGDTEINKINSSIKHIYKLNQLQIIMFPDGIKYTNELLNDPLILESVCPYSNLIYSKSTDSKLNPKTLPTNPEAFRLSDRLMCGSYFSEANQIILSPEMANSLGNPQDLIGSTLDLEMYDGTYRMEIIGVFSDFSEVEKQYITACGIDLPGENTSGENIFYINGDFAKSYIDDPSHENSFRKYTLYFNSFSDMMKYYQNAPDLDGVIYVYDGIQPKYDFMFVGLSSIINPTTILIVLLSIIFFNQTQRIELFYNRQMFSVYQYVGYRMKTVKAAWVRQCIWDNLKSLIFSCSVAFSFTIIINLINMHLLIIPFQIFSYTPILIVSVILAILATGILSSMTVFRKIKVQSWNQNLLEPRDLL